MKKLLQEDEILYKKMRWYTPGQNLCSTEST